MATSTMQPTGNGQPADYRFRYAHNIYFEDGISLTGILTALLFLTVAGSLDAAGYVASMGLLIPVTLGAIAMSLLMAYSRFDSFFAFSHGMFTGLAWILFLMRELVSAADSQSFLEFGFPALQAKVYFVLYRLLTWTESAFGGEASADNYMFIFEICFLVWWLTYLGIWSIFRHGYTWRAIIPAGVVLLINTYYAPNSTLWFLVFFAFITIVLLVHTNLAEQQVRWRAQRTYFSQDISFDFIRTGLMYSLLVLGLAWLSPGLGRSTIVRDIVRPVREYYETMSQTVNEYYDLTTQKRPTAAAFGDTLSLGGERNVGTNIIFYVATLQGRYWRAVVFDNFDGRQWHNTAETQVDFAAEIPLPAANWEMRETITQTFQLAAVTGDVIFGAPDLLYTDIPLDAKVQPVTAAPFLPSAQAGDAAGEITFARSRTSLEVNDTYSIISRQTTVTELALLEASTDYPADILDRYLQLPADFSPRVSALAVEVTSDQPTVYEKVKAVESYLRTIPYTDTIAAPPAEVDPVEYFLFDIRTGYCDYYATAMATMLRSLSIPARTASGYAEGTYDEESNLYYTTERDAHTWVEVYFPSYGWIEFEPTAGESPLSRPSGEELPEAGAGLDELPAQQGNQPIPEPTLEDLMNPDFGDSSPFDTGAEANTGLAGLPWWLWAVLTPLLLLAGIWGLRRSPRFGPIAFTPEQPLLLYERLQRWTQRLGLGVIDNETPYEQGRRIGRALPEGRSFITQIIHRYVLHRFSRPATAAVAYAPPQPHDLAAGEELSQAWRALEPIFWKAWIRRLYHTVIRRPNPFHLHKS